MPGIVVEGCDGSGKTTLIRALRDKFHWPVVHVVQPHDPNIRQMLSLVECAPVIFDRFQWSPVAYGEALRKGSELSKYDLWALDGLLMNKGFVTVYCETDMPTMVANNFREEQLFKEVRSPIMVKKIVREYRKLARSSDLACYYYNYQIDNLDTILERIQNGVRPEGPSGVLGSRLPMRWFVGDERADKGNEGISIPFYDVGISEKLMSGTLLHKALNGAGISWSSMALSNSAGEDLLAVYNQLGGPKKVIALGNVARDRLTDAGVPPYTTVPHPQWWRRFRYKDPNGYTKLIREATWS